VQACPGVGTNVEDMARDGATLLDSLGKIQAHVVGFSLGGMVAQVFLRPAHPSPAFRHGVERDRPRGGGCGGGRGGVGAALRCTHKSIVAARPRVWIMRVSTHACAPARRPAWSGKALRGAALRGMGLSARTHVRHHAIFFVWLPIGEYFVCMVLVWKGQVMY